MLQWAGVTAEDVRPRMKKKKTIPIMAKQLHFILYNQP